MTELVKAQIPVKKRSVNTDEAIALFHHHGMYDKEKLFRYRRVSRVNIYSIENFEDYFYGAMAYDTGYVPYFDLRLYDEGFVLMLPDAKAPDEIPEFLPQDKIFQVQKESAVVAGSYLYVRAYLKSDGFLAMLEQSAVDDMNVETARIDPLDWDGSGIRCGGVTMEGHEFLTSLQARNIETEFSRWELLTTAVV